MSEMILTMGNDMKQKFLNHYIFSHNPNLKEYYNNVIDLIRDVIYDDLEELIDFGFEDKDIEELSKCVYDGNPLLIIRCNEFITGYNIKK